MDKGIYTALGSLKADKVKQGNAIHDVLTFQRSALRKHLKQSDYLQSGYSWLSHVEVF